MQGRNCKVGSSRCSRYRSGRSSIVPVGSTNDDGVSTEVGTGETEVIGGERAVGEADVAEVASNGAVEASRVARDTVEVIPEQTKTGMELFEDNCLGLNFADLLEDDPLGHLLEDEETLLDDLDCLSVADNLLGGLYGLREVDGAVEVVDAVEVIEVIERRETTPVVEGSKTTGSKVAGGRNRCGDGASDVGRGDKESRSELGEHGD